MGSTMQQAYGFDVAITFNSVDFRFPTMPSPNDHALRAMSSTPMRLVYVQILLPIVFDNRFCAICMKMYYIDRIVCLKDLKSHDMILRTIHLSQQGNLLLWQAPRVVIDEWGFLRDLLTQAEGSADGCIYSGNVRALHHNITAFVFKSLAHQSRKFNATVSGHMGRCHASR